MSDSFNYYIAQAEFLQRFFIESHHKMNDPDRISHIRHQRDWWFAAYLACFRLGRHDMIQSTIDPSYRLCQEWLAKQGVYH